MAMAGTYVVYPNEVLLQNVSVVKRMFDEVSLRDDCDIHTVSPNADMGHCQHSRQTSGTTGGSVSQQQQAFNNSNNNNNKKSMSSRPFDLLRWFRPTPKNRRKDKEPSAASTPSPTVSTVTGGIHDDTRPYLDDDFTQERILDIDLTPHVALPGGVELQEWLATHTLSFVEHINLIYGSLSEFCCQSSVCTSMIGPGNTQYQWVDERGKRIKCTAPQYIDYVMSFAHKVIYDETVFPTKYGNIFPSSFEATIRKLNRLLLHVLAHIYQCHWQHLSSGSHRLHGHVNTLTYHFLLFNKQFSLVEEKEMEVLDDLFDRLQYHSSSSQRLARRTSPTNSSTSSSSRDCLADGSNTAASDENKENIIIGSEGLAATTAVAI